MYRSSAAPSSAFANCELVRLVEKVMARTVAKGETAFSAECQLDLSHPDVCLLVDRVSELERAIAGANRYVEACRAAIGAREGELLIEAIQRRLGESSQPRPP
jgi:hypothetical protein